MYPQLINLFFNQPLIMTTITKEAEEALFRQLAVFGHETQAKLMKMNVFILGLSGLGIEVAKNLILAGPRALTIHDPTLVEPHHLGSNFYLKQQHIHQTTRAKAVLPFLKELNQNVSIQQATDTSSDYIAANFDLVVVLDHYDLDYLIDLSQKCHKHEKAFIYGGNLGLYMFTFLDFGENHVIRDSDGEAPSIGHVTNITKDKEGIVTLHEDSQHGFVDGDVIQFAEVKGMGDFNEKLFIVTNLTVNRFKIGNEVRTTTSFKIGDTTGFGEYIEGGIATQVKIPVAVKFNSFAKSIRYPFAPGMKEIPTVNFQKFGVPDQLHQILNGVLLFHRANHRLPTPLNEEDATQLVQLVKKYQSDKMVVEGEEFNPQVDEQLVRKVALYGSAQISPICSFWGGVIAQEIIKLTGKYSPVRQWLHNQFFEALAEDVPRSIQESRYGDYALLFGDELVNRMQKANIFVVGAGALGCEFLKMYSLMGVGTHGSIVCTDDDSIEMSNLNRQFLFRKQHIGKNKSQVACAAAHSLNPAVNIISKSLRVSPENEEVFGESFFGALDFVVNAVDNVLARKYIDDCCVLASKPFFESGTLGTKCHSQVILPHLTLSYNDISDPVQKSIPLCTLKNFPYQIEHTIQWARDYFQGIYAQASLNLRSFYESPQACLASIKNQNRQNPSQMRRKLESIAKLQKALKARSYSACVQFALQMFQFAFTHQIAQLLHCYPINAVHSETKKPFWGGIKRFPQVIVFNIDDPTHFRFVEAATNIFAFMLNIKPLPQQQLVNIAKSVKLQEPAPKNIKIEVDEKKEKEAPIIIDPFDEQESERLLHYLGGVIIDKAEAPEVVSFEKDNPANFHIQFVSTVSNLRARNYHIEEVNDFQVKLIAGKIIPAIATTTACIVGIIGLQNILYFMGRGIESFKDVTINLALPMFVFSDPNPPIIYKDVEFDQTLQGPIKAVPKPFDKWEIISVQGPLAINEFIAKLEGEYKIEVDMINYGVVTLFSGIKKAVDIAKEIERITKVPLPAWKKSVYLSVSGRKDNVDCIIPNVKYFL